MDGKVKNVFEKKVEYVVKLDLGKCFYHGLNGIIAKGILYKGHEGCLI